MRDIVEEVLSRGDQRTPPGEVQDVRVAVVGVGRRGVGRLSGIGRRLRDEAFSGQVPTDIDAVGVDLPGEETSVEDWTPTAWHVVESLERPDRDGRPHLTPAATDRLRRFAGDELDRYDVLVEAADGTDPAAVSVASDLAAAFRGGIASPVICVPTVAPENPPAPLLGAESGWLPDTRDRFGPDAVVPVEHGRATEVVAGEACDRGPLATGGEDPVERVAEDVTAALAGALGTRTQFESLADDLHHLRGRVIAHVGRDDEGPRIDADALAGDALATPVSDEPPEWRPGGPWLAHLRTPDPDDDDIDAAVEAAGAALDDAADIDGGDRPATLRSYRLTERGPHGLFLFRVEAPEEPEGEPLPHIDWNGTDRADVDLGRESLEDPDEGETANGAADEAGSGLDVVR
ncbi:hypothetical protein [Haloglomus litoreum]|uniref:hypothetical protein n=1 Tax=Haloglomus litoreum TaxID=3034026 RepID=UPI0023E8F15B|nr:hypothetical protein [Haloglomus sp. DT116]